MKYFFSATVSCFLMLIVTAAFAGEQTWSFNSDADDWESR